jgi:tetratricopeptide (TPR) repeat protein
LGRLEAEPASAVNALRLRLRGAKESSKEAPAQAAAVQATLDKFVQNRLKSVADEAVRKDVLTGLLLLLVRESLGEEALRICRESAPLDAATSASCLANALAVSRDSAKIIVAAEPLFTAALAAKPGDPDLNFALGNLRYVNGRRDEAIAHYRKVLAARPQHKLATNNLALALADDPAGLDEAQATIARALEAAGRDAGLLDTQAVVLLWQKKAPEARQILEEAMLSHDSDPLYLLHLAAAYRREGNSEKARRTFERAVDLNAPQNAITPGDRELLIELQGVFATPASAN